MKHKRHAFWTIIPSLFFISVLSGATPSGDWPCFRGPNHDGKSLDKGLLKSWPEGGPKLLWKVSGIGKGFSSASISGGRVFVTGDFGDKLNLMAFDLSGRKLWQIEAGLAWTRSHPGTRGSPTVDGDNVYLLSGNGELGCFDARSGQRKWQRKTSEYGGRPGGWGYAESVLIHGTMAIFKPGGSSCIVALNKLTGGEIWRSSGFSAGPEYSSCFPFTHAGKNYIMTGTRAGIVCVNAKDGKMVWQNDFAANNTANCPTPIYQDGYVVWANGYGKGGICLELQPDGQPKEKWRTRDLDCHHGGFIIEAGHVYGNHGGGWVCLDLKTGEKKWGERGVGKGSICWADGMLYLFGENGGQAALATCSPTNLEIKGRVKVEGQGPSWAHPVVAGGRLYLRYDDTLYCFDVKAK